MRQATAIVLGLLSGGLIYVISVLLFSPANSEDPHFIFYLMFFAAWAGSSYLLLSGTKTVSKVFSRGLLFGAVEWLAFIPAALVYGARATRRIVSEVGAEMEPVGTTAADSAAAALGSAAGMAGAFVGAGIVTMLMAGFAFAMSFLCLLGFVILYFLKREMKPEA